VERALPQENSNVETSMMNIPRVTTFRRFYRVFFSRKLVVFGLIVILVLIATAVFAPLIAPYDPYKQDLDQPLIQPNREHLLGTDSLGRDTLSRVIFGTRISLIVGISAILLAGSVGITLGLIAGYFGSTTSAIIMRAMDAMMAIPMLALVLVVASMLGGGLKNVVIALSVGAVAMYARMMCGQCFR